MERPTSRMSADSDHPQGGKKGDSSKMGKVEDITKKTVSAIQRGLGLKKSQNPDIPPLIADGRSFRPSWLPIPAIDINPYSAIPAPCKLCPPARNCLDPIHKVDKRTLLMLRSVPSRSDSQELLKEFVNTKTWMHRLEPEAFCMWLTRLQNGETNIEAWIEGDGPSLEAMVDKREKRLTPLGEVQLMTMYALGNDSLENRKFAPRQKHMDMEYNTPPCVRGYEAPLNHTLAFLRMSLLDDVENRQRANMILAVRSWIAHKTWRQFEEWLLWVGKQLPKGAELDDPTTLRIRRIWATTHLILPEFLEARNRNINDPSVIISIPESEVLTEQDFSLVRYSWIILLDAGADLWDD